LFFVLSPINAIENDYDFYRESVNNKDNSKVSSVLIENENIKKDYQEKFGLFKNFSDNKKVESIKLQGYNYGSNLIWNGNFESGHSNWNEWYKSFDGNWYDYDFIITAGSGGYDSWYAYINDNGWLISNYNKTPSNTVDFRVSYSYRLVHWGTCTSAYGTNGVGVYLDDRTANGFYTINSHNAETDEYNYNYVSTSFLVSSRASLQSIADHDIYIDFLHINDDPNCTFAFYLDNVSVEPVLYVPDYIITTSAGSNGSITSGNTLAQGSSYTVNVTPNSGYEIADVLVDGVSVGPVKYYTFNNLTANHSIQANFQVANTTSQRIYRFWSNRGQHHFYTANDDELSSVVNNYSTDVWHYEGVGYRAFTSNQSGTVPLYRFWSDQNQGHFYTASEEEKNYVINNYPTNIWRYEGIAFYVYPADYNGASTTIYRFWSDQKQGHFYTASEDEKNYIIDNYSEYIWKYEGGSYKVPID